jgi:Ca-activated chloride channel family protein
MKTSGLLAAVVVGLAASWAMADGFIVPVRPEMRVRGHWAVKYHHVRISVRDQVASVNIDQEFVNTGSGMIEVEYLFPVPPGAAIDSMTLSVDGKDYAARLLPAEEARRTYEDIVRRKKDPALLEYAGFGLYKTRAFPLEAGKPAKVLVHYTAVARKDRDVVEVWYPLNTEKFSAKPIEDVEVEVDIRSAADITSVYSPSHDISVDRKDARHVVARYRAKDTLPAGDFQVFYKAADEDVGATFLTHQNRDDRDGYFLLLVSPNPRISQRKALPKDVVIVFDHSGSMSGKKLAQAKEALRYVLDNLNEGDRFNVVAYSDSVEAFFEGLVPASPGKLEEARDRLEGIEAQGGTNIHEALCAGMNLWRHILDSSPQGARYVIFLTDGLPTVGQTDENAILKDCKEANVANTRIFAFGVGYDVNVRLLDKLAGESGGRSDYVKPNEPIEGKVSSLYAKIKNPVMTGLKLSLHSQDVVLKDMYPRELGDLFEGDQIVLAGRYEWKTGLRQSRDGEAGCPATFTITGTHGGRERTFEYSVSFRPPSDDTRFAFVERIWAMRRIGWLLDQIQLHGKDKEVIDEVVRLSLKYGIMTPYTSFLADETTRLYEKETVHSLAMAAARPLAENVGADAQMAAVTRGQFNMAKQAPAPSGTGGVAQMGQSDTRAYEAGQVQVVRNVRQLGNQAVYRRGNVWLAANAAKVDLEKDANVKTIDRFGDEYFELVAANTTAENQVLASQQDQEELVIELRGQVYRIR